MDEPSTSYAGKTASKRKLSPIYEQHAEIESEPSTSSDNAESKQDEDCNARQSEWWQDSDSDSFEDLYDPNDSDSITDFEVTSDINFETGKVNLSTLHADRDIWESSEVRNDFVTERQVQLYALSDDIAEAKLLPEPERHFGWSEDFSTFTGEKVEWTPQERELPEYDSPYESFMSIWDRNIMEVIARETNKYAKTKILNSKKPTRVWKDTNATELYILFGLFNLIGWTKDAVSVHYLEKNNPIRIPIVEKCMSKNRFKALIICLHFVDGKSLTDLFDDDLQIAKIKPITDYISDKFENMYDLKEKIDIGESIPILAGQPLHEYLDKKSTGLGKRMFEMSDVASGYVWRVLAHPGRESRIPIENDYGYGANVVLQLTRGIHNKGHTLIIDKTLTSPVLVRYIRKQGTNVVGMVRSCRRHVAPAVRELERSQNLFRGLTYSAHCGDLSINTSVARIYSKEFGTGLKCMNFLSTFHKDKNQFAEARMYYETSAVLMDLKNDCLYGKMMIDINNKWYMLALARLLKVTTNNVFVLYITQLRSLYMKPNIFKNYRYNLGMYLLDVHLPQHIKDAVIDERRSEKMPHYPVPTERWDKRENFNRKKIWYCEYCRRQGVEKEALMACKRCRVGLCTESCFRRFHPEVEVKDKPEESSSDEDMITCSGSSPFFYSTAPAPTPIEEIDNTNYLLPPY